MESSEKQMFCELMVAKTSDLMAIVDSDYVYCAVNPAYHNAFGKNQEDILGSYVTDIVGAELFESLIKPNFDKSLAGMESSFQLWVDFPALGERFMDVFYSPVYSRDEQITHCAITIHDITQLKQMEDKVKHLAYHDILTDLPNRMLFNELVEHSLAHAKRDETQGAVLFLDLDGFKQVNDFYGHAVGDELLKEVATRLRTLLRESDAVARFGGDEFTLLISKIETAKHLSVVAQKLVDEFQPVFAVNGHQLTITASVGISVFPVDGNDPSRLIVCADKAMYKAKENGGNGFEFFVPEDKN